MNRPTDKEILIASFQDLSDDFSELLYLFQSARSQLTQALNQYKKKKQYINDYVFQRAVRKLDQSLKEVDLQIGDLNTVLLSANKAKTEKELIILSAKKDNFYQLLRSGQLERGSLITVTDWQSPTFLHSLHSLAGRQTGEITGTINDYKRDQHNDEKVYEQAFLNEYIETKIKLTIQIYAVHSGMAALQTILTFVFSELSGKEKKVLIGKSSYFENKDLIDSYFQKNVSEADEMDEKAFCKAIDKQKPSIIVLDTLGNTPEVSLPDIASILKHIGRTVRHDVFVVIDNSCLPIFCQPLSLIKKKKNIRLLVFESLNKYHQFGMDRVTGGIIWAWGKNTGKLYYARDHSGTNISDAAVFAIPKPNNELLTKRLLRFQRNARLVSESLSEFIEANPKSPFLQIFYPGLSNHPSQKWAKNFSFHGSYFRIAFKKKYQKVSIYQQFISEVIKEAKKQKVQIVSGTSFGMNTSRIYLTALRAERTEPFIRFSVGTENRYEIERIAQVLTTVMKKFSRSLISFLPV